VMVVLDGASIGIGIIWYHKRWSVGTESDGELVSDEA
jgi:hypothetical protein